MSQGSYWNKFHRSRLSRRRALVATGGGAAAALFLAACGGDGGSSESGSSQLFKPEDSTGKAKAGGVIKDVMTEDVYSFDVFGPRYDGNTHTYPRLLKYKTFKYPEKPDGSVEGDLAESFEFTPDKLQLTLKLRQGLKWDSRAPTSGRIIDAEDVNFSWKRYVALSPYSADIAYKPSNPNAAVEALQVVDPRTIVLKLRQPDSDLFDLLSTPRTLYTMPREAEGGFDPRTEMRGYGPWLLDEYSPSVRVVWRKNPDYYVRGRPYPDKIEVPIIREYATRLAQFRTGNIYIAGENTVKLDDVLETKRAVPDINMFQSGDFGDSGVHEFFGFGYEGESPWDDLRMRQAAALLIDRESYTDLITGRDVFAKAGIPVPTRWVTWVPTDKEGFWLDPQNEKEFGPAAKYFKYDPKEAKALMAAAGFASGVNTTYTFQNARDPSYDKFSAIIPEMLNAGGLKVQTVGVDNATYVRDILRAYAAGNTKGPPDGKGITQRTMPVIASVYLGMEAGGHPGGRNFIGFTPDGKDAHKGDPEITALFPRMKTEFDMKKQQAISWEFQRLMAQKAYAPNLLVDSPLFEMAWPCVGNFRAFDGKRQQGGQKVTEGGLHLWIDDSKPPFRKA